MKKPILQLKNVSKNFPGVKALQDIDFSLYSGEVHVLAGENGAGKSTLTKCILGVYQADQGEMIYEGSPVHFQNTKEAIQYGMGAVYQELTMIPYLNAAENIFFQREPKKGKSIFLDRKKMYEDAREILKTLHCDYIDLHSPVCNLSMAQQQMIEIAKALTLHPKVLIFDEPTTSLTGNEVAFLFQQIRNLKEQGIAILFISHRMKEMWEIGDRITILRDGQVVHSGKIDVISPEKCIQKMIGREVSKHKEQAPAMQDAEIMLEAKNLCDRRGKLQQISFHIRKGEIVGFAGLVGSGRTEIANLLYGINPISSGEMRFKGNKMTKINPHDMVSMGMGFVPEDRKGLGLAVRAPIHWNITAGSLAKHFPSTIVSPKKSVSIGEQYVKEIQITTTDSEKIAEELSGGNQQKVVLAKWFAADSEMFIFDEPTRGIDVGAKQEIYQLLRGLREKGKSLLMISSDMQELMEICDRIYVVAEGRIVGELSREEFSQERIGKMIFQNVEDKLAAKAEKKSIPFLQKMLSLPPAFYMGCLLFLFFACNTQHMLSLNNLSNIFSQSAALFILACGQAMVVLIQGTDLSLGSVVSLVGILWFVLLNAGVNVGISLLLCLLCGALCGLCNGVIIAKGKIPVFIVTLGTQNIFKSLALLLCGSQTLYYESQIFRIMGKDTFLGLSYISWISVLCFLLTLALFSLTDFGLRIRALGGNPQGITYSGGNVSWQQIKVFLFAGIMAAISGLVLCCRIESGNPNAGMGMEFNSIAAVLLGGLSMREGKGQVQGILFGVLMIQILKSGLTQIGMSSFYQNATIGIVVLLAIIIDAILKKMQLNGRGGRTK